MMIVRVVKSACKYGAIAHIAAGGAQCLNIVKNADYVTKHNHYKCRSGKLFSNVHRSAGNDNGFCTLFKQVIRRVT